MQETAYPVTTTSKLMARAEPPTNASSASKPTTEERNGVTEIDIECSYDVDSDGLVEEDLDSEDAEEMSDSEDLKSAFKEAEDAFTTDEVNEMVRDLKEKGMITWMKEYVINRAIPINRLLQGFGVILSRSVREEASEAELLPLLKVTLTRALRRRERLPQYNTIEDVLNLLRTSKNIIVLTGAGISVSCGIPDFRSSTGLYAMLGREGKYELDDPQQMFDVQYFKTNPEVFYSFASQIYPSNFTPSPCHRFIKALEAREKLLRNYTQNIDTLETIMGVKRVLQCHGSFATASCLECRTRVNGSEIKDAIFAKQVPYCKVCSVKRGPGSTESSLPKNGDNRNRRKTKKNKNAKPWEADGDSDEDSLVPPKPGCIMKPDITFFGEPLTDTFDKLLFEDREKVDLLVVIGTSLKVAPVSEILSHLPHSVPQVLINKTPVPHVNPDVILLGDADGIVEHLCQQLGWELPIAGTEQLAAPVRPPNSRKRSNVTFSVKPKRVGKSHVWLFDGAEGGMWLDRLEKLVEHIDREDQSDGSGDSGEVGKLNPEPVTNADTDGSGASVGAEVGMIDSEASRSFKKARTK